MSATGHVTPRNRAGDARSASLRRTVFVLLGVVLGAVAILRALDAVPGLLRGEPRTVREYATLEALERETRTQLLLPFYFPDTLAWPPRAVYRAAGDGTPTSVAIADRQSGATRLVIVQCLRGTCQVPERFLPPGEEIERQSVRAGEGTGTWTRARSATHGAWSEVAWVQHGRQIVVRIYGDDAELMRIVRSFRRGHP
jgi:hypothetical protein